MLEKVQGKLKELFGEVCSLAITTDLWTSLTTDSYNGITVHYFNPKTEKLESKILDCAPFEVPHTGEELKKDITRVLKEFAIEEKIATAVSDNAANIKLAIRGIGVDWLGCIAHTLNLIFKDGYDDNPEVSALGKKFCKIVETYRVSYFSNPFLSN